VDRLRSYLDGVDPERREYHAVVLAAADPANPYGAALPWPSRKDGDDGGDEASHRPGRKAGALVALVDGELTWFLERGGRSLLSFTDDAEAHAAAATALAELVSAGRVQSLLVEKVNGASVLEPGGAGQRVAVQDALVSAGFSRTPRGLRLR
jgi:ATP-dependent Lhr-like helicase